jgi:hypothetical protein
VASQRGVRPGPHIIAETIAGTMSRGLEVEAPAIQDDAAAGSSSFELATPFGVLRVTVEEVGDGA